MSSRTTTPNPSIDEGVRPTDAPPKASAAACPEASPISDRLPTPDDLQSEAESKCEDKPGPLGDEAASVASPRPNFVQTPAHLHMPGAVQVTGFDSRNRQLSGSIDAEARLIPDMVLSAIPVNDSLQMDDRKVKLIAGTIICAVIALGVGLGLGLGFALSNEPGSRSAPHLNQDEVSPPEQVKCSEKYRVSTIGADLIEEPSCGNAIVPLNTPSPGRWFSLVGRGSPVTISTCNKRSAIFSHDTRLRIYERLAGVDTENLLQCVAGTDDDGPACEIDNGERLSTVSFDAKDGVTYWILADGQAAAGGTFFISIDCYGEENSAAPSLTLARTNGPAPLPIEPTDMPTLAPTSTPTGTPTGTPTDMPTTEPSRLPTPRPTMPTGSSKLTNIGNNLGEGMLEK